MKKGDLIRSKTEGYYGIVFDTSAAASIFVLRSNGLLIMDDESAWENVVHEIGGMVDQSVSFVELVESRLALERILAECASAQGMVSKRFDGG